MRAATIALATALLGTQAAVVPREATETTNLAEATTTMTGLDLAAATETAIAAADETTSTIEAASSVEATPTAEAEPEFVTDKDCADSAAPHSTACLKKWWHAAGCMSRDLPTDQIDSWTDNDDINSIQSEMTGFYDRATATGDAADTDARDVCEPLPKPITQALDCVENVATDTCKDCFSTMELFGIQLPTFNATCVGECLHAEADNLAPICPNLNQALTCHDTLKDTCGKCMKKKREIMGMHIMDVDDDCFEKCYWDNKDEIRSACALPKPLKQALDCHKALKDECEDCVDDGHKVDAECVSTCIADKDLSETCPEEIVYGMETLADVMPDEDDIEYYLNHLLSNINLPFSFDIESIFNDVVVQISHGMKPHEAGDDDDNGHSHDDEADSDDDDEEEKPLANILNGLFNGENNNNNGQQDLEAAFQGIMNQVFGDLAGQLQGAMGQTRAGDDTNSTETPTPTAEVESTETATPTPTEDVTEWTPTEEIEAATAETTTETETEDEGHDVEVTEENPLISYITSYITNLISKIEANAAEAASSTATIAEAVVTETTSTELPTETETMTEATTA